MHAGIITQKLEIIILNYYAFVSGGDNYKMLPTSGSSLPMFI